MNYELLRTLLKEHEGYATKPYVDSVGKITIGIGHNLDDLGISDDVIQLIFHEDIEMAVNDCQRMFDNWHSLPDKVQVVLCDMMFNLGYTRLSKFKQMRAAIDKKHYRTAADEMKNSKWYRQVKSRGVQLEQMMRSAHD